MSGSNAQRASMVTISGSRRSTHQAAARKRKSKATDALDDVVASQARIEANIEKLLLLQSRGVAPACGCSKQDCAEAIGFAKGPKDEHPFWRRTSITAVVGDDAVSDKEEAAAAAADGEEEDVVYDVDKQCIVDNEAVDNEEHVNDEHDHDKSMIASSHEAHGGTKRSDTVESLAPAMRREGTATSSLLFADGRHVLTATPYIQDSQMVTLLSSSMSQSAYQRDRESRYTCVAKQSVNWNKPLAAHMLPGDWPSCLEKREASDLVCLTDSSLGAEGLVMAMTHEMSMSRVRTNVKGVRGAAGWRVLDPHGRARVIWDLLGFMVLLYDLAVTPVMIAWDLDFDLVTLTIAILVTSFWTVDIGLNMCTGFYKDGAMINDWSLAIAEYFRRWFLIDVTVVVADFAGLIASAFDDNIRAVKLLKAGRLLRIVGLMRKIRGVWTQKRFLHGEMRGALRIGLSIGSALCASLLGCHLLACAWWMVGVGASTDTGLRWTKEVYQIKSHGEILDQPFKESNLEYQYASSLHYVVALLTLGGVEIHPTNSVERAFSIACLLLALFYGGCLVSLLSAAMVGYQMDLNKHSQILTQLSDFLKEHDVDRKLALRAEHQVMARLREPDSHTENEVEALLMLSPALRTEVRQQVFQHNLVTHGFFLLCHELHETTITVLCNEAVKFTHLRRDDELFTAGVPCISAYYIKKGAIKYLQTPEMSEGGGAQDQDVDTCECGGWLSEAVLWSEWFHVGVAVALTESDFLAVEAEIVADICAMHPVVAALYKEFARVYHRRVISAVPPAVSWPTDLDVPSSHFSDIVPSMLEEHRVAVGLCLLRRFYRDRNSWSPLARHRYYELKQQVLSGASVLALKPGPKAGGVVRVVSIVVLQIEDADGEQILVQLAKRQSTRGIPRGESSEFNMNDSSISAGRSCFGRQDLEGVCLLPGSKVEGNEMTMEVVARIIRTKLPPFKGILQVIRSDHSRLEKESHRLRIPTVYQRCVMHLKVVRQPSFFDARDPHQPPTVPNFNFKSAEQTNLLAEVLRKPLIGISTSDYLSVCAWLTPQEFQYLSETTHGAEVLHAWMRSVVVGPIAEAFSV